MVSRCIRTNGGECEGLSSPEQRSFHTEHGKGLVLTPGTLGFQGEGTGSLTLCDGEGISLGSTGGITLHARGNILVESGGSIRLDALTQVVGQSLLSSFSAFCMNDRFDYLSPCTILEGREARRYDPFKDAPVEGQFDWGGFFRNLAVGNLVAVGCIALAAIPGVGPLLTGALLGAALGAAGETIYMAHKEFSSGNVRDTHEMVRDLTIATVGGFFTGACAVGMPIASLFWKVLACAGINTSVNTLQRAAWAEMDGLEDKAGYIFDPEQMLVDFGNGMSIGITVPQLVAVKVYEQPVPQRGVDADPPKGSDGFGGSGSGSKGGSNTAYLDKPAQGGTLNIGAGTRPIENAYNIDINPTVEGVYQGSVTDLSNVTTGSQSRVIMQNPYKYDVLNPEINRVLQNGGVVEISGGLTNGTFKKVYYMSAESLSELGYEIVFKGMLENAEKGFTTTGKPVNSTIYEIILRKIGGVGH